MKDSTALMVLVVRKLIFKDKIASNTVVGETLAVFSLPQIRKTCQCLDGQVDTTFSEIFGGNYNFLKFREAMNALFFNLESPTIEISICRHLVVKISVLRNSFSRDFFDFWSFIRFIRSTKSFPDI